MKRNVKFYPFLVFLWIFKAVNMDQFIKFEKLENRQRISKIFLDNLLFPNLNLIYDHLRTAREHVPTSLLED